MKCTICNKVISNKIYCYGIDNNNNKFILAYYCLNHGKLLKLFLHMKRSNTISNLALRDRVIIDKF